MALFKNVFRNVKWR